MDYNRIFEDRIQEIKNAGHYRYFLDVNKSAQHFPKFYFEDHEGKKRMAINWCSNDYLCMSVHEEVISKLSFAAHRSGAGSGGTRNISGTTVYHRELEETLARLHHQESALLFSGAYLANLTTLGTLGKLIPGLVFLSDERNHASIVEGIRSSRSEKKIFRHNDLDHLESLLKELPSGTPRIIVFESVYSISGTVAPVVRILELAKNYQALTFVDEVHAVGLYGMDGGGITSQEGVQGQIDIINGTLAKGFGVMGGYIAAKSNIVDSIRSFGSGFIFTTSLPPAVCAAATRSIELLTGNHHLREEYKLKVSKFRSILTAHGISFSPNHSHITSIPIGDPVICKSIASSLLYEKGIYIQPVFYPTVPQGEECLRVTVTARHEEDDMIYLAESLQQILDQPLHHTSQQVLE